jgi:hypothetical protein
MLIFADSYHYFSSPLPKILLFDAFLDLAILSAFFQDFPSPLDLVNPLIIDGPSSLDRQVTRKPSLVGGIERPNGSRSTI